MTGSVILVGAGPGDPGLLTLRGKQALEQAQVVVFDRLVSPDILALIPPDAEQIDVGKQASNHPVPQAEINQILLEQAQKGRRVVRLKGGDPFLFGRGGEELELLQEHQIPFQVVPGVTSALAAPAYGGIPVTHRDFTSSLHIITGHKRAGEALDIDFTALVRTKGTLVFLMGVSALPTLCHGLMDAGMQPETPAAIVERGTTPTQRRISATVGTLEQAAASAQIQSPAVIVVGGVCALADRFDWFDALPLKGRRVIVTRPKARSGVLTSRLRALGAEVLEYPCIETVPIRPCPEAEGALDQIAQYEWLAFTSPAGVEALVDLLDGRGQDARMLAPGRIAAIGPGTARALRLYGLKADYIPETFDAGHLGMGLAERASGRVLLLRAEEGSPALTEALDRAGVPWDDVAVYHTHYENPCSAWLRNQAGQFDLVTFTSASTVKGFVSSVGEDWDFSQLTGACIGGQTEQAARSYGMKTVTARAATIEELISTIEEALQ